MILIVLFLVILFELFFYFFLQKERFNHYLKKKNCISSLKDNIALKSDIFDRNFSFLLYSFRFHPSFKKEQEDFDLLKLIMIKLEQLILIEEEDPNDSTKSLKEEIQDELYHYIEALLMDKEFSKRFSSDLSLNKFYNYLIILNKSFRNKLDNSKIKKKLVSNPKPKNK
jgi:hypothetical protein